MKTIAILGSTGSIGTQTLEVVRSQQDLKVAALAVLGNITMLEQQIREFRPSLVCVYQEERAKELQQKVKDTGVRVVSGMEGLIECALVPEAETVVSAVVGMIGIRPVMEAIAAGKDIAFANKETLVTAGHLIMPLIKKHGVKLLPVDSEHSAIFQSLQGSAGYMQGETPNREIAKLILTASGGPFRGKKRSELAQVTVEDALRHPNWSMGKKITIDSATMVNKGLEVMEAKWLFDVPTEKIEVVIQPQSVIHSAVEFVDGGIIAQLGTPDMKLPIQYALYYPERRYLAGKRLSLSDIGSITFEKPDMAELPGLALAYEAMNTGGSMPVVFNAANEYAVAAFLKREIGFTQITDWIGEAMAAHKVIQNPSLEEILFAEQETYDRLREFGGKVR
ncbi:MAG: 1-deoxy-D-xylulose-5-phosphate reductoisomerase [Lachnospiraceae bacterium]|nr:1-deoxy-D-xylulose-5-phosphate reductoisomerase [Lachnospiraceae bacterium]